MEPISPLITKYQRQVLAWDRQEKKILLGLSFLFIIGYIIGRF